MAKSSQAQEPSMEEILASIRRIISEDDGSRSATPKLTVVETPAQAKDAAAHGSGVAAPAEEPLAATLPEPKPVGPTPRAPEAADDDQIIDQAAIDEILELSEDQAAGDDFAGEIADITFTEPPPKPAPAVRTAPSATEARRPVEPAERPEPPRGQNDRSHGLLSERADEAVHTAFNQLAATFLSNQARTLESLVKEMMRPILKSWLDDNLPALVERLVREEIERVSRGRR